MLISDAAGTPVLHLEPGDLLCRVCDSPHPGECWVEPGKDPVPVGQVPQLVEKWGLRKATDEEAQEAAGIKWACPKCVVADMRKHADMSKHPIPTPQGKKTMPNKADPVFIQAIRGNIKADRPWLLELGPHSLLVGENGAGKTRALHAIELCLTGAVSDMLGRDVVKATAMLRELAPEGQDPWAELVLSDGRVLAYRNGQMQGWTNDNAPGHVPRSALPIRDLEEELFKSPQRANRWIGTIWGASLTQADVRKRIPEALRGAYDEDAAAVEATTRAVMNGHAPKEVGGLDILLGVSKAVQEKLTAERAKGREAGATKDRLQQMLHGVPDIDPDEVRIRINTLAETIFVMRAAVELAGVQEMRELLEKATANAQRARLVNAAFEMVRQTLDRNLSQCLTCNAAVTREQMESQLAVIERAAGTSESFDVEEAEEATCRAQLAVHEQALERLGPDARSKGQRYLDQMMEQHEDRAQAVSAIGIAMQESERERFDLQTQLTRYRGAADARSQVENAISTLATMGSRIAGLKDLQKACVDALNGFVQDLANDFIADVQRFMPEGHVFAYDPATGRVALEHTAVSGAELNTMLGAISMAAVKKRSELKSFHVVIPSERAYDPETLQGLMRAWKDAPCQVILTSPVSQKGRLLKGWTEVGMPDAYQWPKAAGEHAGAGALS